MENNFYMVTSPTGGVNEYFDNRKSAIAFIVDEFAMANSFRYDDEGDRLTEYLLTNDETPNQYQYKYIINVVRINREYDEPKRMFAVKTDDINGDCEQYGKVFFYNDYESAKEKFNQLVDNDKENHILSEKYGIEEENDYYYRWNEEMGSLLEHFSVTIVEMVETKNGYMEK